MGSLIRQSTEVCPETFQRTDHYGRYLYDISAECVVKGGAEIDTLPTGMHGIASLGAVGLTC